MMASDARWAARGTPQHRPPEVLAVLGSTVRRICVPLSVLLLLVGAGPVLGAPQPVAWSGPVVYAGEKAGPIAIPNSANVLTTIASLSVPVGKWVAFAKFDGHVSAGGANITCDLIAGSGSYLSHWTGGCPLASTEPASPRNGSRMP